jgi:hypothetical protein
MQALTGHAPVYSIINIYYPRQQHATQFDTVDGIATFTVPLLWASSGFPAAAVTDLATGRRSALIYKIERYI